MKRFPGQSRDIWLDTGHGMLERSIMFVVACCHVHITHARALLLLTATCVERCEKDISWCWHWSENRHFAAISELEPGDITKVVAGSSDPFFASGFDESIVYCRQSYRDLSRGLVTTDQSGSSFFEDSYISLFFSKPPRLPSQQVNMWCIHKWFDYWTNMSQRHSYTPLHIHMDTIPIPMWWFLNLCSNFNGSLLNFGFASFCSKDRATGGDCVHQQFIEQCDLMLLLGGAGVTLNVAGVVVWGWNFGPSKTMIDIGWVEDEKDSLIKHVPRDCRGMSTIHGKELFNAGNGSEPSTTSSI